MRIQTGIGHRPVTGVDSCIATAPEGLFIDGAFDLRVSGRLLPDLAELSHRMARSIGEKLRHATWCATDDPEIVEKVGMHGRPDCARCRSSVDQALSAIADTGKPLLVGELFWAG